MKIKTYKTRVFVEKENLVNFVKKYIKKIPENSVIVITSKIVALSEGRTISIDLKIPHDDFREKVIKSECEFMIKTPRTWLTIKNGMVMASAGIDESNANGKIIRLPKDSYKIASQIRKILKKYYKVKNLGILITDSRLFPFRAGVVGVAMGYAGFYGIRDYRGEKDIFGRVLKVSRTDVADSLATSAVLEMGEGDEQKPVALITNSRIVFCERVSKNELHIDIRDDMYGPLFSALSQKNT